MEDFKKDIEVIRGMKSRSVFKNYIDYIRYPNFRNLEKDSKISFDFPLTFFVGKNGGGKSSTLQSLYGCPKGNSLGEYWFETALDPIQELKDNRNCFIYSVDGNEILKQRAPRTNDRNYWEPARPVLKYDMDVSKRHSPIDKHVEYIDFRSELSSYDRYMYFSTFSPSKTFKRKQDFISRYSKKLSKAIQDSSIVKMYNNDWNKRVIELSSQEVSAISFILGKEFSSVKIIDHKFFKDWGFSVKYTSPNLSYSEAFAGSGETAITILVHKIHNIDHNSLLLLDEPEVSLHPGAQIRLRKYIIEQIKMKKIQVVISTHSPFFIEHMPKESIKVFSTNSKGEFHIENQMNPKEAFFELEVEPTKTNIVVEDETAKMIVETYLERREGIRNSIFNVTHMPGGATELKQRIEVLMNLDMDVFILLDGDQKKVQEHHDLNNSPPNTINTIDKLDEIIRSQTACKIKFHSDGGNHDHTAQKIDLRKKYLEFYLDKVFYLPRDIPEDIIWSKEFAIEKLTSLGHNISDFDQTYPKDTKECFRILCSTIYNELESLKTLQKEFTLKWINEKEEEYRIIDTLFTKFETQD